jgi:hypothetical protein
MPLHTLWAKVWGCHSIWLGAPLWCPASLAEETHKGTLPCKATNCPPHPPATAQLITPLCACFPLLQPGGVLHLLGQPAPDVPGGCALPLCDAQPHPPARRRQGAPPAVAGAPCVRRGIGGGAAQAAKHPGALTIDRLRDFRIAWN